MFMNIMSIKSVREEILIENARDQFVVDQFDTQARLITIIIIY